MPTRGALWTSVATGAIAVVGLLQIPEPAEATPAFARKQLLACGVCHTAFPQLNATGRAYLANGYRMRAVDGDGDVETTGTDLGGGLIVDTAPGLAVRVVGQPLIVSREQSGDELEVETEPLDEVELIGAGSSGDHWSYMAHVEAEVDDDFRPAFMGLVQYRFLDELTAYGGYTIVMSRDLQNSLDPERRLDHAAHAAVDYEGSVGVGLSGEAAQIGAFGKAGPVFYLAMVTPGPESIEEVLPGTTPEPNPLDYAGRVAVSLDDQVTIGALTYVARTADDSTVRTGLDLDAFAGPHALQVVALYDTADGAVLGEIGWNAALGTGPITVVPLARLDVTLADRTIFAPTAGISVLQAGGRAAVELTETIDPDGELGAPEGRLFFDVAF